MIASPVLMRDAEVITLYCLLKYLFIFTYCIHTNFRGTQFYGLTNFRIFAVLFSRITHFLLRLPTCIRKHRAKPDNR